MAVMVAQWQMNLVPIPCEAGMRKHIHLNCCYL